MRTSVTSILVAGVIIFAGCGEGVQPDQREMVYFAAIETDTLKPTPIPDPGIQLSSAQTASSAEIANGFLENHERLLADGEVTKRIEQIENIFLALGRFHEIMAVYRDDWEKRGTSSFVADRYAWGLVRLGQRKESREVINQLLVARPTEGRIHFLDGAQYLEEQPPNPKHFSNIVRAWKRVLDFEPNYSGFEGINAALLKQEIVKFEAAIPADAGAPEQPTPTPTPTPTPSVEPEPETPPAVEPETPPEVDVQPPVDAPEVVVAEPSVQPHTSDQKYQIEVAKGQIALGQGNYRQAEEAFLRAKAMKPGDFAAEFGHLQSGWGTEAARNKVSAGMRKLAERKDLAPGQRIELGTFLWTKVGRNDLAREQWELAKKADPAMGPRIDGLLKQLK